VARRSEPRAERLAGVDVGGSALKLGVCASDGSARLEETLPVRADESAETIFAGAARILTELAEGPLAGVGVGLPGLLDRAAGCVRQSPNLPWLEDVPVATVLGRHLGLAPAAIRLENDANVAALGELWLGAAKGERELLLLTLGTGIGGGLILNGKLYVGEGLAGEIGHVNIAADGPPCGCGSRGCLEQFASASAARRRALEHGLPAEAPGDLVRLAELARARAGAERVLLEAVGYDLGRGLAAVVSLLDVRTFLFGGGFSAALDVLTPGIRRALVEWCYGERVASVRLIRASLGSSAGWIGAARLALG
jgi:glucokinase